MKGRVQTLRLLYVFTAMFGTTVLMIVTYSSKALSFSGDPSHYRILLFPVNRRTKVVQMANVSFSPKQNLTNESKDQIHLIKAVNENQIQKSILNSTSKQPSHRAILRPKEGSVKRLIPAVKRNDTATLLRQIQAAREYIEQKKFNVTSAIPILLLTYMRSGSSWLGSIVDRARESFYLFEPLMHLQNEGYFTKDLVCLNDNTCRKPTSDYQSHHVILKNMIQLFNCDLANTHPKVLKNLKDRLPQLCALNPSSTNISKLSSPDTRNVSQLSRTKVSRIRNGILPRRLADPAECMKIKTRTCEKARQRLIKTIRLSMELVEILMELIPNLKVIHLVRDPRGITKSRLDAGYFKMTNDINAHSKALCKEMHNDVSIGAMLRNKYPTRINMVTYEALVERPIDGAKHIFNFLGIVYDKEVEKWVYNSTHGTSKAEYYSVTREDPSLTAVQWRKSLPFSKVQIIQNICADLLHLLGYVSFNNEADLKNFSLSSRGPTLLDGFN